MIVKPYPSCLFKQIHLFLLLLLLFFKSNEKYSKYCSEFGTNTSSQQKRTAEMLETISCREMLEMIRLFCNRSVTWVGTRRASYRGRASPIGGNKLHLQIVEEFHKTAQTLSIWSSANERTLSLSGCSKHLKPNEDTRVNSEWRWAVQWVFVFVFQGLFWRTRGKSQPGHSLHLHSSSVSLNCSDDDAA